MNIFTDKLYLMCRQYDCKKELFKGYTLIILCHDSAEILGLECIGGFSLLCLPDVSIIVGIFPQGL